MRKQAGRAVSNTSRFISAIGARLRFGGGWQTARTCVLSHHGRPGTGESGTSFTAIGRSIARGLGAMNQSRRSAAAAEFPSAQRRQDDDERDSPENQTADKCVLHAGSPSTFILPAAQCLVSRIPAQQNGVVPGYPQWLALNVLKPGPRRRRMLRSEGWERAAHLQV